MGGGVYQQSRAGHPPSSRSPQSSTSPSSLPSSSTTSPPSPSPSPSIGSPRSLHWGCLLPSSLVAMGSTIEAVRMQRYRSAQFGGPYPSSSGRWAVASVASVFLLNLLSLALQSAPVASAASSRPPPFAGTKAELVLILAVSALSIVSVIESTNPATGLAVNASGGVGFGSLYYSTWTTFVCCLGLLTSYARTERGIDLHGELNSRGRRLRSWAGLAVASVVVMGSAASCYDARCRYGGGGTPTAYCRRAAFGVAAGCAGGATGLAIVAMRLACDVGSGDHGRNAFVAEFISGLGLLVLYCFAVAYLTSELGPGAPLGNLYYSTWTTFGLALSVAASCLEEIRAARGVMKSRDDPMRRRGGADAVDGASDADVSTIRSSLNDVYAPISERDIRPWDNGSMSSSSTKIGSIGSGSVGEVQVGI